MFSQSPTPSRQAERNFSKHRDRHAPMTRSLLASCMPTTNPAMVSLQLHVLTNVSIWMCDQDNRIEDTLWPSGSGTIVQLASQPTRIPILDLDGSFFSRTHEGDVRSPQPHSPSGRMGFSVVDTVHLVCEFQSWPTAQPRCSPLAYPLARFVSVLLRSHALLAISVCQLHHS